MIDFKSLFTKSKQVEDPDDYVPLFDGSDTDPSQEVTDESWFSIIGGWIKGLIALCLAGALFVGILYTFLAAFLIMWVPIGSEANYLDRANIVRNTWSETGGVPNIGDKAIISLNTMKSDTSWIQYALYGWTRIPASAEVEILSSDRAKLYIEVIQSDQTDSDGRPLMTGKVANLNAEGDPRYENFTGSLAFSFDPNSPETPAKQNVQMDGEVLVQCVSGDCIPDSVFIIDTRQIFGERNEK